MRPRPLREAQEAAARKRGTFAGLSLRLPGEERAPRRMRNRFIFPGGDASGGANLPTCTGRDSSLCLRVGDPHREAGSSHLAPQLETPPSLRPPFGRPLFR